MSTPSRLLLLALALALSISAIVPVTATSAEGEGLKNPWVELLEYGTVNDAGKNTFSFTQSVTVSVPVPLEMRAHRVEMLVSYNENQAPATVSLVYNGQDYPLTVLTINSTTARVYGTIPAAFYKSLNFRFTRTATNTAWYEMFSCRITALQRQDIASSADMDFWYTTWSGDTSQTEYKWIKQGESFSAVGSLANAVDVWQARVNVWDWDKFDSVTIWGAVDLATINSIRATVGSVSLPVEVNFLDATTGDYWADPDVRYPDLYGRYVFSATIDVSGLDPTTGADSMEIYLTGKYWDQTGMIMQFQSCTGSLLVADTGAVTWWQKFTAFMRDLFGANSQTADEFQDDMHQQVQEVQDAADQIDKVTRPPLDDVNVDLGAYVDAAGTAQAGEMFGQLFDNALVLPMVMISLLVALAAFVIFGKR